MENELDSISLFVIAGWPGCSGRDAVAFVILALHF